MFNAQKPQTLVGRKFRPALNPDAVCTVRSVEELGERYIVHFDYIPDFMRELKDDKFRSHEMLLPIFLQHFNCLELESFEHLLASSSIADSVRHIFQGKMCFVAMTTHGAIGWGFKFDEAWFLDEDNQIGKNRKSYDYLSDLIADLTAE